MESRSNFIKGSICNIRASLRKILKVSAIGAAIVFLISFIPSLLVLLLNTNIPEFNKALTNFVIGGVVLYIFAFIAFLVLCCIYVTVSTRYSYVKTLVSNIRASSKRILLRSAYMTAFVFIIVFGRLFLLLLLNPDRPEFGRALANLVVLGVFLIIYGFIAFLVLILIYITLVTIWRRYHPRVAAEARSPAIQRPVEATQHSQAVTSALPTRRYLYLFTGSVSGFLYIMYYVGRSYFEGFFGSLGIPKGFISYQLYDYIYFGAQIDTILITVILTAVLIRLLMTWFRPQTEPASPHNKVEVIFVLGYLVIYSAVLIYCVFLQIFRPDLVVQKPFVMIILMTCVLLLGLLIMLLYFDPDVFSQIISTKNKRSMFIAAAIITLLFSPYMSGKAWGAYKGQIVQPTDFPQVELYTNGKLTDGIKWAPIDNAAYRSDQDLYLIAKTTEYIFLKTSDNTSTVYVLKPSDILSIKILSLGKTK